MSAQLNGNDKEYLARPIEVISLEHFNEAKENLPPFNHQGDEDTEKESYRFGDELTEVVSIFFVRIGKEAFKLYALKETTHDQLLQRCYKLQLPVRVIE